MKIKSLIIITILLGIVFIFAFYVINNDNNKDINQRISSNTTTSNTVYGTVYVQIFTSDVIPKPITDAKVTLLKYGFNSTTGMYQILDKVNIPDNPLTHTNVITDTPAYSFNNLQKNPDDNSWGYSVAIEKDGHMLEMPATFNQQSGVYYNEDRWDVIPQNLTNNTIYGYVDQHDFSLDRNVPVSGANIILRHYNNLTDNTNIEMSNALNNTIDSSESGPDGFFRFDGVPSGYYELIAEKNGFKDNYRIYFYGNEVSKYQINCLNLH
jgi:hypothetical protein